MNQANTKYSVQLTPLTKDCSQHLTHKCWANTKTNEQMANEWHQKTVAQPTANHNGQTVITTLKDQLTFTITPIQEQQSSNSLSDLLFLETSVADDVAAYYWLHYESHRFTQEQSLCTLLSILTQGVGAKISSCTTRALLKS